VSKAADRLCMGTAQTRRWDKRYRKDRSPDGTVKLISSRVIHQFYICMHWNPSIWGYVPVLIPAFTVLIELSWMVYQIRTVNERLVWTLSWLFFFHFHFIM